MFMFILFFPPFFSYFSHLCYKCPWELWKNLKVGSRTKKPSSRTLFPNPIKSSKPPSRDINNLSFIIIIIIINNVMLQTLAQS